MCVCVCGGGGGVLRTCKNDTKILIFDGCSSLFSSSSAVNTPGVVWNARTPLRVIASTRRMEANTLPAWTASTVFLGRHGAQPPPLVDPYPGAHLVHAKLCR